MNSSGLKNRSHLNKHFTPIVQTKSSSIILRTHSRGGEQVTNSVHNIKQNHKGTHKINFHLLIQRNPNSQHTKLTSITLNHFSYEKINNFCFFFLSFFHSSFSLFIVVLRLDSFNIPVCLTSFCVRFFSIRCIEALPSQSASPVTNK